MTDLAATSGQGKYYKNNINIIEYNIRHPECKFKNYATFTIHKS